MMDPKDGYIAYIINPKSGASGSRLTVRLFQKYLIDRGFSLKSVFTRSLSHAGEISKAEAMDSDCKLVIIAGGDGTVREAAHGLEGSDTPFLIVPCGTENLLANEIGLDYHLKTLINVFENGIVKSLDLGKANGRCFTSIAGFGFDGDVVKLVSDSRDGHIHHLDYFWPIWRTFWDYKFPPMKVEIDGEKIFNGRGLVFVGNISRYAIGLQILHYANYGDGLLDVCIYKCSHQVPLLCHSFMTVLKKHADSRSVIYKQGKHIIISSDAEIRTELDGDPGPPLPLNISIIPQAVKVLVPKDAKPAGIRTRFRRMLG